MMGVTTLRMSGGYIVDWDDWRYSFDFSTPPGSEVLDARDGDVLRVGGLRERERGEGRARVGRSLTVLHEDGTFAVYGHRQP